jgi:hypothetical protein
LVDSGWPSIGGLRGGGGGEFAWESRAIKQGVSVAEGVEEWETAWREGGEAFVIETAREDMVE